MNSRLHISPRVAATVADALHALATAGDPNREPRLYIEPWHTADILEQAREILAAHDVTLGPQRRERFTRKRYRLVICTRNDATRAPGRPAATASGDRLSAA